MALKWTHTWRGACQVIRIRTKDTWNLTAVVGALIGYPVCNRGLDGLGHREYIKAQHP
jgi:hypothetical protein